MKRVQLLITIILYSLMIVTNHLYITNTTAQESLETQCFDVYGIDDCLEGNFLEYWRTNGALPVFGYPITGVADELNQDTNQVYPTQWLERNRFEWHEEHAGTPYQVLLGLLGKERLAQLDRDWASEPREAGPKEGCLWFEQTGHNVCNQQGNLGFKTYWEAHGLKIAGLDSYAQSLQLFGLPLTEPQIETNAAGDTVVTQWFERARFEWHPNNPDEYKVLLGLLGQEVHTNQPIESEECTQELPTAINGMIEPACISGYEIVTITGSGFTPEEELGFYTTTPSGTVINLQPEDGNSLIADESGTFLIRFAIDSTSIETGIYAITFEGKSSGHKTIVYFEGK